ncbi:hypothetical protein [Halobacteriovorax sp. ZH4_bin.1]|uniref:hypothetical protein n=1 Tax=unclassified Halobacteriovorax TaxID=2639665 RepID=UPI0037158B89
MSLFRIVALVLLSLSLFALPIGHESGFLGNTTSRPGDIGAALVFPSATAYLKHDEIKIYFGLMYTRQDIDVEGTQGSDFESQFIPYFTGFAGDFFGITFTNFVTYSGTNNGTLAFDINGIRGSANIQGEETVLGISAAKKLNKKIALGFSGSLNIQSSKTFSTFYGNIGGDEYLQTINNRTKYIIINTLLSASYIEKNHFLSASLAFPGIKYSSSSTQESFLRLNADPTVFTRETTKPSYKSNPGINLGYSYLSPTSWSPSFEIFYDISKDIISFDPNQEQNRNKFSDDIWLKLGLSSPEYTMSKFYKGTTYSFLLGFQYREVENRVAEDLPENISRTYEASVGFKLTNRKASPIFGLYYQTQDGASDTSVIGLMYSSNYNIFD